VLEQDAPVTVTDRNGAFTFAAVPAGQYSLSFATRAGFSRSGEPVTQTLWAEMPVTVGGADLDGVTVTLQPGIKISGRVEFEGARERPAAAALSQVRIMIQPADLPSGGGQIGWPVRFDANGQFTSTGIPAGRYLVGIEASPVGWMFRSAALDGRDLSETPLELRSGDVTGVVITFSDRWTGLRGVVRSAQGAGDPDATVLVFPTDPQAWAVFGGGTPRRIRSARASRTGEYAFGSLPAGDYYAVALEDQDTAGWQDPKVMETLVSLAVRVSIGEGEQKVQELRTRTMR
jgi:hypothetical protein